MSLPFKQGNIVELKLGYPTLACAHCNGRTDIISRINISEDYVSLKCTRCGRDGSCTLSTYIRFIERVYTSILTIKQTPKVLEI